eukprot:1192670-Prorocentrum_minimum.AAC.9
MDTGDPTGSAAGKGMMVCSRTGFASSPPPPKGAVSGTVRDRGGRLLGQKCCRRRLGGAGGGVTLGWGRGGVAKGRGERLLGYRCRRDPGGAGGGVTLGGGEGVQPGALLGAFRPERSMQG